MGRTPIAALVLLLCACEGSPSAAITSSTTTSTTTITITTSTSTSTSTSITAADTQTASGAVDANATVVHVVDGDTVDFIIDGREERVRLIGIDTPETKKPNSPIECFGPEATAYMQALLPVGTPVRIERDIVNRDDYGRLLGYVYRADDGIFVNYEVMRQGFAQPLSIDPNTMFEQLFADAARDAHADDAGLWAACSG